MDLEDLKDYFCRITTDTYLYDIMYEEYFFIKRCHMILLFD